MQMLILLGTAMIVLCSVLVTAQAEPLCDDVVCRKGKVCRVLETCDPPLSNSCTLQPVCLSARESEYYSGGCLRENEPLLELDAEGGYDTRSCYTARNCPEDFYCSTALADAGSRCCRAAPPSTKAGSCPQPDEETDTFFCVDQCRGDGDCLWADKCCRQSQGCPRKRCFPPEPCSVMRCPQGSECITDEYNNAHCVPRQTEPDNHSSQSSPADNNNNDRNPSENDSDGNAYQNGRPSCPSPWTAIQWRECGRQCSNTWGGTRCPWGKLCCYSIFCGLTCL